MSKLKNLSRRSLVILAVMAVMISMVAVVSAATIYNLDQTKSGTITITSSGGGGGGGGDTTVSLLVYEDAGLTTAVSDLNLSYASGASASKTVYVSANAGTVQTTITSPDGPTITATPGDAIDGVIPIRINVSGGSEGTYGYSVNFSN